MRGWMCPLGRRSGLSGILNSPDLREQAQGSGVPPGGSPERSPGNTLSVTFLDVVSPSSLIQISENAY